MGRPVIVSGNAAAQLPLFASGGEVRMITKAQDIEDQILALARQHGITAARTALDDWCEQIARLSDAEVPRCDIDDLLVNLTRSGILTLDEASRLHGRYLKALEGEKRVNQPV